MYSNCFGYYKPIVILVLYQYDLLISSIFYTFKEAKCSTESFRKPIIMIRQQTNSSIMP